MEDVKILIVLFLYWFSAVQGCGQGAQIGLDEHNRLRKLHGVPDLTLNEGLCKRSAEYAEELAQKKNLQHSEAKGEYGENLCFRSHNPEKCVQNWYDEIHLYDFSNPKFSYATGHFTQLVWKASTDLGWGEAQDSDGTTYVVAMYTPSGNVNGQFEENVPRAKNSALGKITVSISAMIVSICFGLLNLAN